MSVTTTSDVSSAVTTYTSTATGSNTLGQEDFLQLLVAQLENQDPLDPQSNTEFIAQLATFSSLEQQTLSNDKLDSVITATENLERTGAFALLNDQIVVQTDSLVLSGDDVDLGIALTESASDVSLSILDANNSVVATLTLTDLEAGDNFFNWDGCDADGNTLANGEYSLSVSASNDDGSIDDALPLVKSSVNEVALSSAGSVLVTDAGEVLLSEIYAVVGLQ